MSITPPAAADQPIDWQQIDGAIHDWLDNLLGIAVDWENQDLPQPAYPYISLLRSGETDEGGLKETQSTFVSGQPSGQEIQLLTVEPVAFTLTVTAHVDRTSGANDPGSNAMKLLSKAKASLGQESVRQAFSAAGFSVVNELPILDTSVVVNENWNSKATMDVIFRTSSVMTEKTGYMDKVKVESSGLGVDLLVDAS